MTFTMAVFGQPDGVTLRQLDISLQRHSRAEVTRNDTSAATLHRLFRMELQIVADHVLSSGPEAVAMAFVLRDSIRHCRDQQLLLSAAGTIDVRVVAQAGADAVRVCRQGESLPHAHEATA